MKVITLSALCILSLHAADGLDTWFKEGSVYGNLKYYYINTERDGNLPSSSQHANAIGGQLGYVSGSLYGFKAGATLMGSTAFALVDNIANTDSSLVARYDSVRVNGRANGPRSDDAFIVLGEAYGLYNRDNYQLWYGRKVIETPLIDAREVARMLPSAVEGTMGSVKLQNGTELSVGYLSGFKQRASTSSINIVEHVLGAKNTRIITGRDEGYMIPMSISYKNDSLNIRMYDYYVPDFMNSVYADATLVNKLNNDWSYAASAQGIHQESIGNANSSAAKAIMGGEINAQAVGAKVSGTYQSTMLLAAYSHVFNHEGAHDSLVTPWDGAPLFTNMLTANNLFISDYGKGLGGDAGYIGGTTAIKVGISQKLDLTSLGGITAGISFAQYNGSRFLRGAQEDINGELVYVIGNFSLSLKGIWSSNNTAVSGNDPHNVASIKISDEFTQYRVISNYKF